MWANNGRSAVTWTHFVLPRQQHKSHSQMYRSAVLREEATALLAGAVHSSEDPQETGLVSMEPEQSALTLLFCVSSKWCWCHSEGLLSTALNIPATTPKNTPSPSHPPQSTNTWPWLSGPSLTRGYPAARYAKSLWIPDASARAGLRGDFQRSQTTVGLAGHFALTQSQ